MTGVPAASGAVPAATTTSEPETENAGTPVRFRIDLGYDGTDFHGWAVQPELRTVQGVVEEGLARLCGEAARTVVAGRTDAGVHARRQVVHCDLPAAALERLAGRGARTRGRSSRRWHPRG